MVLEKSIFADNRGSGIWFDIGNENPTVRNCLIANNEDGGIFYEISYGLHAHDNVIVGNGFDSLAGSWGGNGAIALSSSPGCTIERNLMLGNREGFQFREQYRTTPRIDRPRKAARRARLEPRRDDPQQSGGLQRKMADRRLNSSQTHRSRDD